VCNLHKVEFVRVELQPDKLLVGMAAEMSLAADTTPSLWQSFMPRRGEIRSAVGSALYSVQKFPEIVNFESFTPETVFEKWAAVEVTDSDSVPEDMQLFVLRGGYFAVFKHYGPPSGFPKTVKFIFSEWLPGSEWQLDDREHFELLLPGWRADDPKAQEEVWIPLTK
jgi:AraC family transcriptional regulator